MTVFLFCFSLLGGGGAVVGAQMCIALFFLKAFVFRNIIRSTFVSGHSVCPLRMLHNLHMVRTSLLNKT